MNRKARAMDDGDPPKMWRIGLGKRLRLAHMAFSRALRIELAKENVSFGQFVHLERLWEQDGLTQKELSARVGVETASSTTILAELEQLGFVTRERSSEDGRAIVVRLTQRGTQLRPTLLEAASRVNLQARAELDDEALAKIYAALDSIADALGHAYPNAGRATARLRFDRK